MATTILAIAAVAGTGFVLYQAVTARTGHEKTVTQPNIRLEQSDDNEFRTRGMFQLKGAPATVLDKNGSFTTVNVLGQNHTIPTSRLDELKTNGNLVVTEAHKAPTLLTTSAVNVQQKSVSEMTEEEKKQALMKATSDMFARAFARAKDADNERIQNIINDSYRV